MNAKNYILGCSFSLKLVRWLRKKIQNYLIIDIIEIVCFPIGWLKYWIKSLLIALRPDGGEYKYSLSVITIIKNEGMYILEWLAFLKVVGVNHVYIYDNDSTDNTQILIKKYLEEGYVTYTIIHGKKRQIDAYNDALYRFSKETQYMMFIDADEFVYPVDEMASLYEVVDQVFKKNSYIGGLAVNWVIFGSNGYKKRNVGLVIERFTKRAYFTDKVNCLYKSIVNPRKTFAFVCPHYPVYLNQYFAVSDDSQRLNSTIFQSKYKFLRCNHYFTKSQEEFMIKRNRGMADNLRIRNLDDFEKHDKNDVIDTTILYYLDEIKKELSRIT